MLAVGLIFLLAIVTSLISGVLVLTLLMRAACGTDIPGDGLLVRFSLPDILLAGLAALTVHAQFVSLFGGVRVRGWVWLAVGWAVMILFGLRQKEGGGWKRFFITRFSRENLVQHLPDILTGSVLFFLFSYGTSHGIEHYDTGLYHAQAIRWIAEAGLMRGLGNLHTRLAYNPSSLALSALFDFNGMHAMAGFMALLLAWKCMGLRGLFRRRGMEMPDAPRLLAVYYLFMIYDEMVSPAPDYFVNCVLLYLVTAWLDAMEGDADEHSYALLCVLAVYAVTLKLSVAPLLLLTMYAVWRIKKLQSVLIYLLAGCVVIVPFLIRNYYLSGYLIYPFPAIDLFHVPWKIPQGVAMYDAREIAVYGRGYADVLRYEEPGIAWFPEWFEALGHLDKGMFLINCALPVVTVLMLCVRRRESEGTGTVTLFSQRGEQPFVPGEKRVTVPVPLTHLLIVLYAQFLFWFLTAPLVRYGKMILWLPGTLFFGFIIVTGQDKPLHRTKTKHRFLYAGLLLFFLYKSAMLIGDDLPRADVRWLKEQQPYAVFGLEPYQTILYGEILAPVEGDRVGYTLLASPNREMVEPLTDDTVRGGGYLNPKNGFAAGANVQ